MVTTVKELIAKLQACENQNAPVFYDDGDLWNITVNDDGETVQLRRVE